MQVFLHHTYKFPIFGNFWQFLGVNEYFQKVLAENHDGTMQNALFPWEFMINRIEIHIY